MASWAGAAEAQGRQEYPPAVGRADPPTFRKGTVCGKPGIWGHTVQRGCPRLGGQVTDGLHGPHSPPPPVRMQPPHPRVQPSPLPGCSRSGS